jgi:lambda family phage portal protein
MGTGAAQTGGEWERIPARTDWGRRRVIHIFDKQRAGQNRGVPHLAAVMRQFKMLEHYQKTELQAAIVNAMIALFIETPLDQTSLEQLFAAAGDPLAVIEGRLNAARAPLQGGGIYPLFPGEKAYSHNPNRPSGAYAPFVNSLFDSIAVGLGMSPEMFTKNFRESNYSSARMALLETWRFFLGRRQFLGAYWCDPAKDLWLEEAVSLGDLEAPEFYQNRHAYGRAQWIGPGKGWVDPVKEPQGARLRLDGLLSTLERECAEQGLDYEEVLDQVSFERGLMAERGLSGPAPDSQSWLTGNTREKEDTQGQEEPA